MGVQSGLSAPISHLLPDTASYPGDVLHIANHSVSDLVQEFGTPLYIYAVSYTHLTLPTNREV